TATLLATGKVLITGGLGAGALLASAELYDPAKNSWSATDSLHTARYEHSATLLGNGTVLVAPGFGPLSGKVGILASAELYHPAVPNLANSVLNVTPQGLLVGSRATVKLTTKDAAGTPEIHGGLPFAFSISAGTGQGTFSDLADNHDGTYTATFTA